jgi:hypothetical protein
MIKLTSLPVRWLNLHRVSARPPLTRFRTYLEGYEIYYFGRVEVRVIVMVRVMVRVKDLVMVNVRNVSV